MKPEQPTEAELIARAKAKAEAVYQRCAPEPLRVAVRVTDERRIRAR